MAAHILQSLKMSDAAMAHQQTVEMHDVQLGKQSLLDINPTVQNDSGLDVHKRATTISQHPNNKHSHILCIPHHNLKNTVSNNQW